MKMALVVAGIFSGVLSLLSLSSSLFMLEIYDRVVPSKSTSTLIALLALISVVYAFYGFLDIVRSHLMIWLGEAVDVELSRRVFAVIAGTPLRARILHDALKPAQEMDQIRTFLSGPGLVALFELPWLPAFLAVSFLMHPLIGALVSGSIVILVGLTVTTHVLTKPLVRDASLALARRNRYGEAAYGSAEALAAMGMREHALEMWEEAHRSCVDLQRKSASATSIISGISKAFRLILQSVVLALGAWLVIKGEMTGGAIVAGSIVVSRALSPVEQIIANWRALSSARLAWSRLQEIFLLFPEDTARTVIPSPRKTLSVESIVAAPPGDRRPSIQGVSFEAKAGAIVGIIGPSGAGKSSLVRAVVGATPLLRGSIRLDSADLEQWPVAVRGQHIGYLPQNVAMFPATVAQNIARLDPRADDQAVIAAAVAAGVHDLIVTLPKGYDTFIGEGGLNLSAGQLQRIALARALYRDPFLVVLDEPNSNLDAEGDKALTLAMEGVRRRGGIVLIVAHRTNILPMLDDVLVIENGMGKAFGPRDTILKSNSSISRVPVNAPFKVVAGDGVQS